MAIDKRAEDHARGVRPAYRDPIRIVPLHMPEEILRPISAAAPAVAPQLTYRGGPLLANVHVFTVFWGQAWQSPSNAGFVTELNSYFQYILTSTLIDQLAEYSVPQYKIGHGSLLGTATITSPKLKNTVADSAIQHMLQQEISTNHELPAPSANTLYFVYLPPGVAVVQGGARSCQAFCGYHDNVAGQIFYAVMPFPNCNGCTGGLGTLESLTSTSSHELCEAITDPVPGQGWYDEANGEIGDICAWKTKTVGAYTVQLEWSNKANACV